MKFREGEGPEGFLAQLISVLVGNPKFVWAEFEGTWY